MNHAQFTSEINVTCSRRVRPCVCVCVLHEAQHSEMDNASAMEDFDQNYPKALRKAAEKRILLYEHNFCLTKISGKRCAFCTRKTTYLFAYCT